MERCTSLFPFEAIRSLLLVWLAREKQRTDKISAAAGLKDFLALLATTPHNLASIPCALDGLETLNRSIADTADFLKHRLLDAFADAALLKIPKRTNNAAKVIVQSPLAGGIPFEHVRQLRNTMSRVTSMDVVGIGILNPGRCGFSTIDGNTVLWWRLWQTAVAAIEANIQILILSSPRLPPGTTLPSGFPYSFHGCLSKDWKTAAFFILPEIEPAVRFVAESTEETRNWMLLERSGGEPPWAVCACYGPLTGKVVYWNALLNEWRNVSSKYNVETALIAGDLNFHLPDMVNHALDCLCVHCQLSPEDKAVAHILRVNGLFVLKPSW